MFVEPDAAVDAARDETGEEVLDDLVEPDPRVAQPVPPGHPPRRAPTLHFLHLLAPHTPYRHLPDGHQYEADPDLRMISAEDGEPLRGDRRGAARPAALLDRQRLQLSVANVDQLIGDVLDRLRRTGLYDDALLVVTSDHGLAFEPGSDVRGLGAGPIDPDAQPELLWVPLFIKAPGQANGGVSDVPAQSTDVLPDHGRPAGHRPAVGRRRAAARRWPP